MSKPIEILDHNYVALTGDTLIHLRTRERMGLEDAIAQGIARVVDDPYAYFSEKTIETLKALAAQPGEGIQGMVLGIIREDIISVHLVGQSIDLASAVVTLAGAVESLQPLPPPDRMH